MLEKLVKNKKVVIIFIFVLLIVIGVVIAVLSKNDSKESFESGKSNVSIEAEQNKDAVKQNDEDGLEDVDEDGGLEPVKEDVGKTENRTDASGSWESDGNGKMDEGSTNEDEDDIIEDEQTWGEVF